jgi:hypothetical protein
MCGAAGAFREAESPRAEGAPSRASGSLAPQERKFRAAEFLCRKAAIKNVRRGRTPVSHPRIRASTQFIGTK